MSTVVTCSVRCKKQRIIGELCPVPGPYESWCANPRHLRLPSGRPFGSDCHFCLLRGAGAGWPGNGCQGQRTGGMAGRGAWAMGSGIWSMHYTGMLAYRLPIPVFYHIPTVALSLLAAIFASLIALFVVSRQELTTLRVIVGSLLMGAGIATMHYTGMAAMRLSAMHHYHHGLWTLSGALAVMVSLAALWFTYHFREDKSE